VEKFDNLPFRASLKIALGGLGVLGNLANFGNFPDSPAPSREVHG
jgi:hypothetical protein